MVTQVVPFWLPSRYLIIVIEIITHNWTDEIIKNSPCYAYPTISIHIYALGSILTTKKVSWQVHFSHQTCICEPKKVPCWFLRTRHITLFEFTHLFADDYSCHYIIHTQQDCPSQINWMNCFFMLSATKLIQSRIYDEPQSLLLTDPQFCKQKHLYIMTNLIPFVHRHLHFNSLLLGKAPGIGSKPNKPPGVFICNTSWHDSELTKHYQVL